MKNVVLLLCLVAAAAADWSDCKFMDDKDVEWDLKPLSTKKDLTWSGVPGDGGTDTQVWTFNLCKPSPSPPVVTNNDPGLSCVGTTSVCQTWGPGQYSRAIVNQAALFVSPAGADPTNTNAAKTVVTVKMTAQSEAQDATINIICNEKETSRITRIAKVAPDATWRIDWETKDVCPGSAASARFATFWALLLDG